MAAYRRDPDVALDGHSAHHPRVMTPTESTSALTVGEMLREHDQKLDSLLEWRSELRGAMTLVKLAMGASFLSAAVSIVAVVSFLAGRH